MVRPLAHEVITICQRIEVRWVGVGVGDKTIPSLGVGMK